MAEPVADEKAGFGMMLGSMIAMGFVSYRYKLADSLDG